MSRVLLISANHVTIPYPVYPIGMAMVASAVAANGHDVRQFDILAQAGSGSGLRQGIREFAPDVIGVSLRNIDDLDSLSEGQPSCLDSARDLVRELRDASPTPIVLGGPAFSIMPEAVLAHLQADYGVVGEGERVFCELVHLLGQGQRPASPILSARDAPLAATEWVSPRLESTHVRFYLEQSGMLNLQTKRGCPHACSYCTYPSLEGTRYRPRDPAAVVEDLVRLRREHGVETVFFTDSVFNDSAGHYLELAEAMLRAEVAVRWAAFFRPQGSGRRELALLKRSGLYAMEVGTDAAADVTLAAARKGFTFAEVLEFHRAAVAEQIPCAYFVVFGWPGETAATLREGLANLERLEPGVVFAFSGIRVLPGTGLQAQAIGEGVVARGESLLKPTFYTSPAISAEAMNQAIQTAFGNRRDRIFPPSRGAEKLAVLHAFGYRGLLWDRLIPFSRPGKPSRRSLQEHIIEP